MASVEHPVAAESAFSRVTCYSADAEAFYATDGIGHEAAAFVVAVANIAHLSGGARGVVTIQPVAVFTAAFPRVAVAVLHPSALV